MLVWHHCRHIFARFWTRQSRPSPFFPRVNNFSIVTTIACCRFRSARAAFTAADGKVTESARCCPLGPSRCFAMWLMVSRKIFSPSLSLFMLVSCSRACLLVVSRLLGLTLRHFAPVCSCHRDSLTHWSLSGNCARNRACSLFLSLLDWSLPMMTCVWWFLTAYEEGLFTRC